jgi:hypothetical protein
MARKRPAKSDDDDLKLDGEKKTLKREVVAFKVEEELAAILNKLPNKSAFIRKAIVSQLSMACPLCKGSGVLPKGLHDFVQPLLAKVMELRPCDGCGGEVSVVTDPGDLAAEDRHRLEQFFHGGPIYCDSCYETAPTCDDCGWHIAPAQAVQHHRQAHEN